jgi:predicted metalloprotease with PDZ domain
VRRAALIFLLALAPAFAQKPPDLSRLDPARLDVDATDAPRRLIHVHLTLPAAPGPLTLLYPKWIPGEHGPTGPIADLVNLRFNAGSQQVTWKRDSVDLFAFHVIVPAGARSLDAAFDFISPPDAGGFSSGSSMTPDLAVLSWNQFVLYPQGVPADQLRYQARLKLPAGWEFGTALPVVHTRNADIEFRAVSLVTLIDSPVLSGTHFKNIDLGTFDGAAHYLHIVADEDRQIAETPEWIEHQRKLIAEAGALFGARHYTSYHFLLTLSDFVANFGLEHHESSDDRLPSRTFTEQAALDLNADMLSHEYVHSWNGKYRRPEGLVVGNYNEPMLGDLLWVYEGLTEYLGEVLATRAGLGTSERFHDWLARDAALIEQAPGRKWRTLADTAVSAQILYDSRDDYSSYRRGVDFYPEGALLWFDVDTLIRQQSHGARSLDDFCKAFFGGAFFGGTGGEPAVKPYTRADLVAALQAIQPYDWETFFAQRVDSLGSHTPREGITNAGWKLVFTDKRTPFWAAAEDDRKTAEMPFSLGLTVKNDGGVKDVSMGSPAQKAGVTPGSTITFVDGHGFSLEGLREAVADATSADDPIELTAKNAGTVKTFTIEYHGGEKYPRLERDASKPDLIDAIIKPRAKP